MLKMGIVTVPFEVSNFNLPDTGNSKGVTVTTQALQLLSRSYQCQANRTQQCVAYYILAFLSMTELPAKWVQTNLIMECIHSLSVFNVTYNLIHIRLVGCSCIENDRW